MATALKSILALIAILAAGLALKIALLALGAIPFNSDEAVIGLMARHILQGERPVFFYGQAYMGSLDAWLVAGMFAVFGPSVTAIRAVQMLLHTGTLAMTYLLARRSGLGEWGARAAALLLAVPSVMVTLYTTVSLGGYGEVLLLGTTMLVLSLKLADEWQTRMAAWAALGAIGGLAFWVLGQSGVYLLPAAIFLAWRLRWRAWKGVLVAAIAFTAASSPWWLYDLSNSHAAFAALTRSTASGAGTALLDRAAGLFLLGLPALWGLRFPWRAEYVPWLLALPLLIFYLAVMVYAVWPQRAEHRTPGRALLLLMTALFVVVLIGSRFGIDTTGRYLLPLATASVVLAAMLLEAVRRVSPRLASSLLAVVVLGNVAGTGLAAASPDKITTQFGPATRFDNSADQALIDFLLAHDGRRGYANYWISFRLAFESGEAIILASQLPYRENLGVDASDDRYPPYAEAVARSERAVYVTANQPQLDATLRDGFSRLGVSFQETQIGLYRVFYDLSRKVTPEPAWPPSGQNR